MPVPAGLMPRDVLTVHPVSRFSNAEPPPQTTGDPTFGHVAANDGMTILELQNSGMDVQTVQVATPDNVDSDLAVADRTLPLTAGASGVLRGTFPVNVYGPQLIIDVSSTDVKMRAYTLLGP